MGRAIFFQALSDYLRPRRVAVWIFVSAIGALLALVLPGILGASHPKDIYSSVSSIIVFRVVGLASAIFATAIVGAEVEQRTIVYLLTRPVPRWLLLFVRYLASVLVVIALCFFGVILVSAAAYRGNPFQNPLIVKDFVALTLGAFAYNGLFLLTSLMINRAMIVCLLYAFGWELVVPQMPGTMYYLSIFSHMQAVAQHPADALGSGLVTFLAGMLGTNNISSGDSTAVLILIAIVTVAAGLAWFTHFEFVPREDTD
jgi:ABC-2 type transport system permease protein